MCYQQDYNNILTMQTTYNVYVHAYNNDFYNLNDKSYMFEFHVYVINANTFITNC